MGQSEPGRLNLTQAECVAKADELAMLSRKSERYRRADKSYASWHTERGRALGETSRYLSVFLDRRAYVTTGWAKNVKDTWAQRFNDFYLFMLTKRITG